MRAIHRQASASSLGLLRIVIFGTWALIPIVERLPLLAEIPTRVFAPPGPLAILPSDTIAWLTSGGGLWAVTLLVVVGSGIVALGVLPYRAVAVSVALMIMLHQGVVRGFSGHINHAELAIAYTAFVIALFPIYDGLSIVKPTESQSTSVLMYRAPFLISMVIFTVSFSFAGVARLSEGLEFFATDTLRNLFAERWLGSIAIDQGAIREVPWYLDETLAVPIRSMFVVTTLLEIVAPVLLIWRSTRMAFVVFAIGFHVVNLAFLGVTFFENLVLLVVFSEHWLHRVASLLDRETGGWIKRPRPVAAD